MKRRATNPRLRPRQTRDRRYVTLWHPRQIERYMSKISGPLLDRIDLHIEVPAVPFRELSGGSPGTSSAAMRQEVKRARAAQAARFDGSPTRHNAHMSHRQTRQFCPLDDEGRNQLKAAMTELGLSARARQGVARRPHDRGPRLERCDPSESSQRSDQLSDAGPAVVDVSGVP